MLCAPRWGWGIGGPALAQQNESLRVTAFLHLSGLRSVFPLVVYKT